MIAPPRSILISDQGDSTKNIKPGEDHRPTERLEVVKDLAASLVPGNVLENQIALEKLSQDFQYSLVASTRGRIFLRIFRSAL